MVLAVALYAPTLTHGLVDLDDPWLIRDNWILHRPSLASVHTVLFDISVDTRLVLGAEYLPVSDLSLMADIAVWGENYAGFHATNVAIYVSAIALWFAALSAFGIERRIAGLTVLLWAIHPTHAETVAWLSERKGVLAIAFAGACALGYSRFRSGASARWLVLALVTAVLAVWSKALGAFAVAGIAGLELALPGRLSTRRALASLAAVGAVAAAAFVPVLVVAARMSVVATDVASPGNASALEMVAGVHGFYVRLAAMTVPNAVTYPINTDGPHAVDVVLGAVALLAITAVLAGPLVRRWQPHAVVRAATAIWCIGWFPASRIVLPVRLVVVADRYLVFPTLGVALAVSVGLLALRHRTIAIALAAALVVAAGARTLAAQESWRDSRALWARAVESNPRDGAAWNQYADALVESGDLDAALAAVDRGLAYVRSPELTSRRALVLLQRGDEAGSREWMLRAAEEGNAIAMANVALMLDETGDPQAALEWARRSVARAPLYANGYRALGKVALGLRRHDESYAAFARAYQLEPVNPVNRFNLALALIALGRIDEARLHLHAVASEPRLAARVADELARLPK